MFLHEHPVYDSQCPFYHKIISGYLEAPLHLHWAQEKISPTDVPAAHRMHSCPTADPLNDSEINT